MWGEWLSWSEVLGLRLTFCWRCARMGLGSFDRYFVAEDGAEKFIHVRPSVGWLYYLFLGARKGLLICG